MSFGILIVGVVLGGIGTLTFIILSIIALAGGNRRNIITFSTLFLMCLIIALLSVAEMVSRITQKVKSGVDNITEKVDEIKEENKRKDAEYEEWLKSIAPAQYRDSIDNRFFESYDEEKNVYCIPLVYPYRLEMDETYGEARLVVYKGSQDTVIRQLESITEAAFDKSYLLLKRDYTEGNTPVGADVPEVSYILFEFASGKSTVFYNRQALFDEAGKAGYTGRRELEDVTTLYFKLD